ncbi:MAG: hypothetical protein M3P32_00635 [Chloroflexota bacterium]|nr:hypothetical protein [Chloroflexota bacterium]
MSRAQRITRIGSVAGYVAAVSGVVALVTAGLSMGGGQPWETLNDLALLVLIAALAPLMLSFYELGGLTPTPLAVLAQTLGWGSVLTWCGIQVFQLAGVAEIDWRAPAVGAFAIASVALGYIGLWMSGANLLAGRWLGQERWLGVLAGLAAVVFAAGLLRGGVESGLATLGGIGFLIVVPVWALLMARLLGLVSWAHDG